MTDEKWLQEKAKDVGNLPDAIVRYLNVIYQVGLQRGRMQTDKLAEKRGFDMGYRKGIAEGGQTHHILQRDSETGCHFCDELKREGREGERKNEQKHFEKLIKNKQYQVYNKLEKRINLLDKLIKAGVLNVKQKSEQARREALEDFWNKFVEKHGNCTQKCELHRSKRCDLMIEEELEAFSKKQEKS